jgi:hypothetical protein
LVIWGYSWDIINCFFFFFDFLLGYASHSTFICYLLTKNRKCLVLKSLFFVFKFFFYCLMLSLILLFWTFLKVALKENCLSNFTILFGKWKSCFEIILMILSSKFEILFKQIHKSSIILGSFSLILD